MQSSHYTSNKPCYSILYIEKSIKNLLLVFLRVRHRANSRVEWHHLIKGKLNKIRNRKKKIRRNYFGSKQ